MNEMASQAAGAKKLEPVRLEDYRPPAWLVDEVELLVRLDEQNTEVEATLKLRRNPASDETGPNGGLPVVNLDGEKLELLAIATDDGPLAPDSWCTTEKRLVIHRPPAEAFTLKTLVRIHPILNKALSGLYVSNGIFATQCEAEGFRRITYFPDRPDVLARYTVRIEADAGRYSVLLSNGNLVDEGTLDGGRHFAVWHDPFPKPCYLFALVAGKLEAVRDTFTTAEGREVRLAVWTESGKAARARWALESLKRAMRWDEERFGLSCDLDIYNVVAIADFNMGAMENKGLNIFNDKYVLADEETATDTDFENIEAIIGHEYFHNWTGNRITCRDWFQLCLKEGLTVFRDQEFTSDIRSRPVKRLMDVRLLKTAQWPEDSGPLAHPVRPSQYYAIDNLYTATVYEKGAEVVRMLHTLLGEEGFMRGMRLYVERHDGQAVTVEDFIRCFEDATGRHLQQFFRWYTQAGTPELHVEWLHDAATQTLTLKIRQHIPPTPGQERKLPHHIPLRIALFDRQGRKLPLLPAGGHEIVGDLIELREEEHEFVFEDVAEPPVVSLNRGFSAPVRIKAPVSADDLLVLLAHEDDGVARAEAAGQLWERLILSHYNSRTDAAVAVNAPQMANAAPFAEALEAAIHELRATDPALLAEVLTPPGMGMLFDVLPGDINPEALKAARDAAMADVGRALAEPLSETYRLARVEEPYAPTPEQAARRALQQAILLLMVKANDQAGAKAAYALWRKGRNMTERAMALTALAQTDTKEREQAMAEYVERYGDDPLLMDKWLSWQAMWPFSRCVHNMHELMESRWFTLANPNRVRALLGAFAQANPVCFTAEDGTGFELIGQAVVKLDAINPTAAARLATAFRLIGRLEPKRREQARKVLERIANEPKLSQDTRDIIMRILEST